MVWPPTKRQVFWFVGSLITLLIVGVLFWWLWGVFYGFIQPKTPTTRKELLGVFVLMAAGVVGLLTAIAALGNFYISRRNVQQQRDLDERSAQDDALQAYLDQMGMLLIEKELMEATDADEPIRLLAQAQTLTLLERLDSSRERATHNKRILLLFLHSVGLINKDTTMVQLVGADLSRAHFSGADLRDADLSRANLSRADLSGAILVDVNLYAANLSGAILSGANLSRSNLSGADLRNADLNRAYFGSADLSDADLSGADLGGATLAGADLSGAYLDAANVRGPT